MKPYFTDSTGGITIYHGDCREILPGLKADAVVTDPPYGTEGLGGGYGRRQLHSINGRDGRTIANDADLSCFREAWPLMCASVEDAFALVFFAPRKTPELCLVVGSAWHGEVIWDKLQPGLGYTVRYQHESVAVLKIGEPRSTRSPLVSVLRASRIGGPHPHEKPLEILVPLINWSCPERGTVLDPFMGSGSTLVAAKLAGRKAIGIEIEERYCEIAAKRLAQEVFDFGA